jgi:hypothetical protein
MNFITAFLAVTAMGTRLPSALLRITHSVAVSALCHSHLVRDGCDSFMTLSDVAQKTHERYCGSGLFAQSASVSRMTRGGSKQGVQFTSKVNAL